jgi:hypothetical protein
MKSMNLNYRNAFIIATTIPMQARTIESILTTPPRMLGANDSNNPSTPNPIATMAKRNPEEGLTKKLAMAAPIAINEGMLKCGLTSSVCIFDCSPFAAIRKVGVRPSQKFFQKVFDYLV